VATSLDQEAQRRRVLELMDAAQASASQVLGDSNLVSRFTQTPAGYWLERLRSRPDAVRMHGVGITRE